MDSAKNKSIYFNIFFILYMYKYRGIDFNILQYSSLGFRKSTMEQWAKKHQVLIFNTVFAFVPRK
jgi:hypothetical protein